MTTYRVDLIESERGYGQRVEGHKYFRGSNSLKEAEDFQKEYNRDLGSKGTVPDTYWFATDPKLVPDEEGV